MKEDIMFEKATREGYRYATARMTAITTEDLWKLPLVHSSGHSLDEAAKILSRAIKDADEESFVVKKSKANSTLSIKLDIVKHIINWKLEAKDKIEKAVEKKARNNKILQAIQAQEEEGLKSKSIEELRAMLESDV